jgi:hypothetical protein
MLVKKLQLKPGMKFAVVNAPEGFDQALGKLPQGLARAKALSSGLDLVLVFAKNQRALKTHWARALASLHTNGILWVAYPKKSSGIPTDLGMGEWEITQGSDWNPVAMIAIDATWSAVRFRHAPGLEEARTARQEDVLRDADGSVCIDRKQRVVTPPADLAKLLAKNAAARAFFDTLSFTHRREYVGWIIEAKRPETRASRLGKTLDMLSRGKKNPADK